MASNGSRRTTLLLVGDGAAISALLADRLTDKNHRVWRVETAAEAEGVVDEIGPDLVILDLPLPDANGLVLCANLKARPEEPIIICIGPNDRNEAVLAFKLGADDFIAKPFSTDELEARVAAALRRAPSRATSDASSPATCRRIGQLVIDEARCRVMLADQILHLTPTEYRLLCVLAGRLDGVVPREELAERVWGYYDAGLASSLKVHVRHLRTKLRAEAGQVPELRTVRGFGYSLVSDT
jgi:DNA-binding response OmpR family regulator